MFAADAYKLFEGAADAAFAVTLEGEICFWNAAAERLFGYRAADVLNETCDDILKGTGRSEPSYVPGLAVFNVAQPTTTRFRRSTSKSPLAQAGGSGSAFLRLHFEDSRLHRRLIAHLSHDIYKRKEGEQAFAKILDLSKQVLSIGEGQPQFAPVESLSHQEQRILALFAQSKNSGQVAKELGVTLPTLRNHLHAINQTLCTHNRLEAVLLAVT